MNKMIWAAAAAIGATLALGAAAAWAQSLPLPPGQWRATCGEARAYVQGGGQVLSARCTQRGGSTAASTLRYDICRGEIINDNGRLACSGGSGGGGAGGAALPRGSYRDSCDGFYMSGWTLNASCRDSSGRWNRTALDIRSCGDRDIANLNGRLSCSGGVGGGGQLPAGSYRNSCNNAYMSGWTLNASCRDSGGRWNRTALDIRSCGDRDIANLNGRLSCSGGVGGGGQLPAGSYRNSCNSAYMTGRTLNASCRDIRGRYVWTTLDIRACGRRDIANLNGRLTCAGDGGANAGTITLCTQPDFRGRCETIDRAAPRLGRWEIADRARSARVRGRWQACSEAGYRGRCVTLDRDVRNLERIGYGRRISSVRPVR